MYREARDSGTFLRRVRNPRQNFWPCSCHLRVKKQTFLFCSYSLGGGYMNLRRNLLGYWAAGPVILPTNQPTNQPGGTKAWVQSEVETFWRRLEGNMESGPGRCPSPGNEKADYLRLSGVGATWLTTSLQNRLLSSSGPYNSLHLMWVCVSCGGGVRITLKGGWHHNRTHIFRHIWRQSAFFCVLCNGWKEINH